MDKEHDPRGTAPLVGLGKIRRGLRALFPFRQNLHIDFKGDNRDKERRAQDQLRDLVQREPSSLREGNADRQTWNHEKHRHKDDVQHDRRARREE